MPDLKEKILIVDDEPSIRVSMALILSDAGYSVQTAADGFSALLELRREIPDILVSDLNMPGLSGFELLSVIRQRIPTLHVIAMSGAFSGDEVPSGVAADAFYQKGSSIGSLLRLLQSPTEAHRVPVRPTTAPEGLWMHAQAKAGCEEPKLASSCPKCERAFSQSIDDALDQFFESDCVHCRSTIRLRVIESARRATVLPFGRSQPSATPSLRRMENLSM